MPRLFSYGTLGEEEVQLALFGRRLAGSADELVGFERASIRLDDPRFDDGATYLIVRASGRSGDRVAGVALELTDAELAVADAYEPEPYRRVEVELASGRRAFVYVDGRA